MVRDGADAMCNAEPVHLWAFIGISAVVILAPGPDTVIVTRNALLGGRRSALGTSVGVTAGLVVWTTTAAIGVAAIVRESEAVFSAIKVLGAIYLVYLGVQSLRAAGARAHGDDRGAGGGALRGFRQGLLSDLGNPKIAVFFTGLLPQFVSAHQSVLLPSLILGLVFVAMTLAYLTAYSVLAVRFARVLERPRVRAALDRISGVVLIGLGVRLVLEHR
jgi:threonine/homoserine/homoserine lactone efflux protein